VRKNNFSNSFGNDQECLFFQGSVCYRPGTIAEVIFAHCLKRKTLLHGRGGDSGAADPNFTAPSPGWSERWLPPE